MGHIQFQSFQIPRGRIKYAGTSLSHVRESFAKSKQRFWNRLPTGFVGLQFVGVTDLVSTIQGELSSKAKIDCTVSKKLFRISLSRQCFE